MSYFIIKLRGGLKRSEKTGQCLTQPLDTCLISGHQRPSQMNHGSDQGGLSRSMTVRKALKYVVLWLLIVAIIIAMNMDNYDSTGAGEVSA